MAGGAGNDITLTVSDDVSRCEQVASQPAFSALTFAHRHDEIAEDGIEFTVVAKSHTVCACKTML